MLAGVDGNEDIRVDDEVEDDAAMRENFGDGHM